MSANQRGDEARSPATECLFALEPQQITIGREIGKGAFSVVYAGELGKKRVAVKCQPKDADGHIPPFVLKEVQILQRLQHPRLLEFIGACDHRKAKQVWILSEHANNGDIDLLLRAIRNGSLPHVGWRRLALIALDAAQGVAFLHEQHVIHRDIKSSNILLDDQYRAKLCDFGFAMDMKAAAATAAAIESASQVVRRKSYCGTDAYMAPEMFLDEDYDESVDVFSFGVVLMEMLCCRVANHDGFLSRLPQLKFRVNVCEFLDALPATCPPAFARLAEQCVAFEPSERPTARVAVATLEALLAQKQLLDGVEPVAVELRPFTPLANADECEPQIDDDDEEDDDGSDEEDEDDDDDGGVESADGTCSGRKRDDTLDLESDEADASGHSTADIIALPYDADEELEFRPSERQLPSLPPPRHAGVLLKRNRRGTRGWSAKWFLLDGDQLHYSSPDSGAGGATPSTVTPAEALSTLSLRDCRIWKTTEMPELCFHVINGSWKIKRELQAQTRDDLHTWMTLINEAIDFANDADPAAKKKKATTSASSSPLRCGKQPETRCPESATSKRSGGAPTKPRGAPQHDGEDERSSVTSAPLTAGSESEDAADEVYQWLQAMQLQRYTATFKAKGFASIDFIRETGIETADLNFLGIRDPAARKALMAAARVLRGDD